MIANEDGISGGDQGFAVSSSGILTFRLVKFLKVKIVIMFFIRVNFYDLGGTFQNKGEDVLFQDIGGIFKVKEIFFIDQGSFLIESTFYIDFSTFPVELFLTFLPLTIKDPFQRSSDF